METGVALSVGVMPLLNWLPTQRKQIKKRQNSAKRKQRSRDAARCRRAKETEIFYDVCSCLPLSEDAWFQLDKISVLRLALSFLQMRQLFHEGRLFRLNDSICCQIELAADDYVHSLDGFIMLSNRDGNMIYLSENTSAYLGLSNIDLMGCSIYDFTHPCDHEELRELYSNRNELNNSILLRFKCTITNKDKNTNIKSAIWKVLYCKCHQLNSNVKDDESANQQSEKNACIVFMNCPIPHPSTIETPLGNLTFLTQHSIDFKFSYVDENIYNALGYTSADLIGTSLLSYHHAIDSEILWQFYRSLIVKGQCVIDSYRFLAKESGYVWLKTEATVINSNRSQKPKCIVCVHSVHSSLIEEGNVLSLSQLQFSKRNDICIPALSCDATMSPFPTHAITSPLDSKNAIMNPPDNNDVTLNPLHSNNASATPPSSSAGTTCVSNRRNSGLVAEKPLKEQVTTEDKPTRLKYSPSVEALLKLAPEAGDACIPLVLPNFNPSKWENCSMYDEFFNSTSETETIFVNNESLWRDLTPEEVNEDWVSDFFKKNG